MDIPGIKRAGLPVDLDRLTTEGDEWLSAEERYALKTHGVCAQAQNHVFMIRIRTGGAIESDTARQLGRIADACGKGWIHITTRQQVELHHVPSGDVLDVLDRIAKLGLTTRSACGHTMRGVMSCPDAGVGLDEPFDCYPDARAVSDSILTRTPGLDSQMPQRINIAFGGCTACRHHAKVNDVGFVSTVRSDGELGYELWLGGSLGKSMPTLALKALDFVPRVDILPAVHALFDVFISNGDFERPGKARLKFLIRAVGAETFLGMFNDALERSRSRSWPRPQPVARPLSASIAEILAQAPEAGWSSGVRPQRIPGRAMVTVNVPLGDLDTNDWHVLTCLADDLGDEHLYLTRNQNVMFRHVRLEAIPALRTALASVGLYVEGADQARDVRACTGGPVCTLAITPAQALASRLLDHPALARNSGLGISVSGCPNACAQHQIADIGFSGGMVTIDGCATLGYQVWIGGDLRKDTIGRVVGRVAEADVPAITDSIVGVWEALRERGETLADTVDRFGLDAVKAQIGAIFKGRWAPGPEPGLVPGDQVGAGIDRRLPLVGNLT